MSSAEAKGLSINRISTARLIKEIKLCNSDPIKNIYVAFDEKDISNIHFLITGLSKAVNGCEEGSYYEGGEFIGNVILPPNFPFSPPSVMMLTPSGRFEVDCKICTTYTNYHPDQWNPGITIHGFLNAFLSVMLCDKDIEHGVGHLRDIPPAKRKELAKQSIKYNQKKYPVLCEIFDQLKKTRRENEKQNAPYMEIINRNIAHIKKRFERSRKLIKQFIQSLK